VCVSKYLEQTLELFLFGDVLELVAKDFGTETVRHLCAIYQVFVETLDRQDKILALLVALPSAAVCVVVFECLVGSRTLLVDWRVDKTVAQRVWRMCSQLTHALAFLKRKAATNDFATVLEICTRSCLFSIVGPNRWPRMPREPYHLTISLFSNSPTCMWESFLRDVYTGELNTCGDSADCCYWVKATVTFVSDNIEEESEVPKDSIGKVVEVDDDDASLLSGVRIDFGDIGKHWVSKEHFDNICALSQETREGCKHPTGDGGAQLLTAQVLTAHMLHGKLTVSFHTGLGYDRFSNLNTALINDGRSWKPPGAQGRAPGMYVPWCDEERQRLCAKDVIQSMARLFELVSLAAHNSKYSWRALHNSGLSSPVDDAGVTAALKKGEQEDEEDKQKMKKMSRSSVSFGMPPPSFSREHQLSMTMICSICSGKMLR